MIGTPCLSWMMVAAALSAEPAQAAPPADRSQAVIDRVEKEWTTT